MTDDELKVLVASIAEESKELVAAQKETDRRIKETDRQMEETDRRMKETDRRMKETDRQLRELGRQIGGLGNKFGSFTEGMAFPSMKRILLDQFHMDIVTPSVRYRDKDSGMEREIDVMAYANSTINQVYVVEVKSHLKMQGVEQTLALLSRFFTIFPEHRDKALYGIIAAVDASDEMKAEVLQRGLYFARIHDEHFELDLDEGFEAVPYCSETEKSVDRVTGK